LEAGRYDQATAVVRSIPFEQRPWEAHYLARQSEGTPLILKSISSDGSLWAIPDGVNFLLIRKNSDYDSWAEDAARRQATDPQYHADTAQEAEQDEDWFAARFHLRWLVEHSPDDEYLADRLNRAEILIMVQIEGGWPAVAQEPTP
jgi:hypothetical protein